jgi:hypothetical protein
MRDPAAGERRGASRRSLLGVAWVDDLSFYRWVKLHPRCAGLAGGCPTCLAGLAEAEELDSFWMELCESLGIPLNLLMRQPCGQSVDYAGFTFDTWRKLMLIQDEKLVKLLACIRELGTASEMTTRGLNGVKGRVTHYTACVRHLRILATAVGPHAEGRPSRDAAVCQPEAGLGLAGVACARDAAGGGRRRWGLARGHALRRRRQPRERGWAGSLG